MNINQLNSTDITTHLGKTSGYKSQYDKSLLVREPRQLNRSHLEISDNNLPFEGIDIWNAYEVSGLYDSGLPFSIVLKINYPVDSKYIVESKSLKLYLNSFNMTKMSSFPGGSYSTPRENLIEAVARDLSELLETTVNVGMSNFSTFRYPYSTFFQTIEDVFYQDPLECSLYSESHNILEVVQKDESETKGYHSSLLKSNCKVTSQPDWGDVLIYVKGNKHPTIDSLLKYIVSFRDECHFHEEICETIYKRLYDLLEPEEMCVLCLYTRRGGIDINPLRCTHGFDYQNLFEDFDNVWTSHCKTIKQ